MSQVTARYDGIDVEILDRESHRGHEVVQIQATDDGVRLSDPSGEAPWVPQEAIEDPDDGLHQTPENAVALAEGRTPDEAQRVREEVEE